ATDRVVAVSRSLAEALARDGVPARKLEIAPNGVAAERFARPHRDPGSFTAGFAGSLKAWHGIETLIDAVQRVPGVQLEVVGQGPQEHVLDRLPPGRLTRFGALDHDRVI